MGILRESSQSGDLTQTEINLKAAKQGLLSILWCTTGTARGVPSAPPEAHACSLATHLAPTPRRRAGGCGSTHALNRRPYAAPGRPRRHPVPISGHHRDKGKKDTGCCAPSPPARGPEAPPGGHLPAALARGAGSVLAGKRRPKFWFSHQLPAAAGRGSQAAEMAASAGPALHTCRRRAEREAGPVDAVPRAAQVATRAGPERHRHPAGSSCPGFR